ncbi:MAG TPA: serine/threonine protein phosphatase [Bacteroidetes bacterium]|nr:serine/threonine protein phosphatase [Bacteroidota bacterium]
MMVLNTVKKRLSTIEQLERELHLKQLQVNSLQTITQAINNNVSSSALFEMYASFLSWEMGVKKMALFFPKNDRWVCTSHINIGDDLLDMDISEELIKYTRLTILNDNDPPFLKYFDVAIPIRHKETRLACVLIGGFDEKDDMYGKVRFITTITNIIAVAIENKRLFKTQLEQERLKKEMELASEMQHLLIPKDLPKTEDYELASIYVPHLNVGGDYFDFVHHDDGRITFCIADIAGKGVAAALLMSNLEAAFHTLLRPQTSLSQLVRAINTNVLRVTKGDRFLTFFVAQYCKHTRQLIYVNAGHNPPALAMSGKVYRLDKGCTVLGAVEEIPLVEEGSLTIQGEALLLLYTDGLVEQRNEKGEFLNEESSTRFLLNNYHLSAQAFNEKMMEKMELFKGEGQFDDDLTVLTCKIF